MASNIFVQSNGPKNLTAVFEDNGRVAYTYLLLNGKIEGDVWLYNHDEPPIQPEWTSPDLAPFKNPFEYAHRLESVPENESDIEIKWKGEGEASFQTQVYIRGELFGILKIGAKPGWSKLAKKDGPLAKVLI